MRIKKYFEGFVKNISTLALGSIFGQLLGFVGSVFLTRLFTKSDIGAMTVVYSVYSIFAPVINGRFDYSIVKEKKEKYMYSLMSLSIITGLVLSAAVACGSYFYFSFKDEIFSHFISAVFVFILSAVTAFSNVFRSYNNRIGDYKTMTKVIVLRMIAEQVSIILFGLMKRGYIALLIAKVLGQFFGMYSQTKNLHGKFFNNISFNKKDLREVFSLNKQQFFFNMPSQLMNSASYSMLNLFVASLYGLECLAVYSISSSVLGLPLSVISGNVSKVYLQEAAKEKAETGSFRKITKKTFALMGVLSVAVFIGTFFVFPILVPIVYGETYESSGGYIRILSFMFAVRFLTASVTVGMVVADKQQREIVFQGAFFVIAIIAYVICRLKALPVSAFLTVVTIGFSIVYLLFALEIFRLSGIKTVDISEESHE
ncbi:MAG: oligosaccharide flippase family protein [Clostridiales bacterium]|nr:oligosaccharide flippase family protein [Clostridiales bacterium]